MKKLLILILVAVLLFTFTGCETSSDDVYTIAMDTTFKPFEYMDEEGNFVGIDVDILNAIALDQGIEFQLDSIGFDAALSAVQSGQADGIMAGCSITEERKLTYDFSDPYYDSSIIMGVASTDTTISSYEDLRGLTVAVKSGTEGYTFAQSIAETYGFTINVFEDSAAMYQAVISGNFIACFEDYAVLEANIASGVSIKTVTEKEQGSSYGFAVKKGENAELLEYFNTGLANIIADGTYDEIILKYTSNIEAETTVYDSLLDTFNLFVTFSPRLLEGLLVTIQLTILSLLIAIILGLTTCFFKISKFKILRAIATVYVDIIRGTPLMVQAFFLYFGLTSAFNFTMTNFIAGVVVLSLNAGAYLSEIFRGGISAINKGQMEAAMSLGLPYSRGMMKIVLPQAMKNSIPSTVNQFIITLKDTSIISVLGTAELMNVSKQIVGFNMKSFEIYGISAVMYFVVIFTLTKFADKLERRFNGETKSNSK